MSKNAEKNREHQRKWREKNRQLQRDRNKANREEKIAWFKEYKSQLKCARCEENHPACLDFHHLDPSLKETNICRMLWNGWSMDKIKEEIAKCSVLCSNCHRKLHWNEKNGELV